MGACYSVDLSMKIKKNQEQEIIRRTNDYMDRVRDNTVFENRNDLDTLDGCVKSIITDREYTKEILNDGTIHYVTYFDASYGWARVLVEWFEEIVPCLRDGSEMEIYPDNWYETFIVENGGYTRHSYEEVDEEDDSDEIRYEEVFCEHKFID